MPLTTRIMMAVASLLVLLTIIQLVRRKRLDEKYAFLWVAAGLVMLFAPLATRPLDALSMALGVHNPGFILMLAFFAICLINLQFSVVLSRLNKHNKQLAQRLALLEQQLNQRAADGGPQQ
ncbi:MAG TPA: DUF2304 domain-containing protein [Blastocatellia bacterium]|nr:DUF2304 domain-containing protein [Blastocatellia bacterium]